MIALRFRRRLLGTALGALLAAPPAVHAQTLNDVLQLVLKTNPDIQVAKFERLAADEQLRQAAAGYLPSVDLAAGVGREDSNNSTTRALGRPDDSLWLDRHEASLTLTQMLFDGFATSSRVEQQGATVEAAQRQLAQVAETTALRAVEVYLDVLRRQAQVDLAKDNVATHEKTLAQVRLRFEKGAGRKADVQQADSRVAYARATLVQAEGNLRDAEARYLRVVGERPGDIAKPPSPAKQLPKKEEEALSQALSRNTALLAAQKQLDAARAAYRGSGAPFYPRVDFELGVSDNRNTDGVAGANEDLTAMLRMRYNLYRGGADSARRQETAYGVSRAQEVLERTRRTVEETLHLSWNALQNARTRLKDLRRQVKASEQVRESYRKQFTLGQRTLLDLLDSENELYTARSALITGEFTEMFGVYRVLASTSRLLDVQGLSAPLAVAED